MKKRFALLFFVLFPLAPVLQADWFDDGGGSSSAGGTSSAGTTVYPATATASFPYGFDLNTYWGKSDVSFSHPVADGTGAVNFGGPTQCLATGNYSVIGGGDNNTALADYSTVSGGWNCDAAQVYASVGGGFNNVAYGEYSAIGGGSTIHANGNYSAIAGGYSNTASLSYSFVGGGYNNTAYGEYSVVNGGYSNSAEGSYSFVGGGYSNLASGNSSTISSGYDNTASGSVSVILGGIGNIASGISSFAGGSYANSTHFGSFVWADGYTGSPFYSIADNEFAVQAYGGMRIVGPGVFTSTFTASDSVRISTISVAPTANPGQAMFFSTGAVSAEMWVMDGAGNKTQISPHNQVTGEWRFLSCNQHTGRCYEVPSMERLINTVERLSGETLHREWTRKD